MHKGYRPGYLIVPLTVGSLNMKVNLGKKNNRRKSENCKAVTISIVVNLYLQKSLKSNDTIEVFHHFWKTILFIQRCLYCFQKPFCKVFEPEEE